MRFKYLFAIIALFILIHPLQLLAQSFTLSGAIKDAENGEDLIGATVSIKELPNKGASANPYGFYSLTVPSGKYTVRYNYIGYQAIEKVIFIDKDQKLNIQLTPISSQLAEVVIAAAKEVNNVTSNEMNVTRLSPKEIESVPVLFGEKDIIKTLQLTPGVKAAGEGNAGFYVRGGAADQNLIILDEAPVYNASHLLGFFSTFNSDAVKDVTLYKGGMPAEYGGRASSVMDVKMKDGNNKKFDVSGGIGLISSRLNIEGPIAKDKSSFIISARRTYIDAFLRLSSNEDLKKSSLYFYDLNTKANFQVSARDRLFLSGYFGRDNFGYKDLFGFNWGNSTATMRWNHLISSKVFSNTSIIYSKYRYLINVGDDSENTQVNSSINDLNIKQDFSFFPGTSNSIKFGGNLIHHTFRPGKINANGQSSFNEDQLNDQFALEGGIYVQNDQDISNKFGVQYGLRYSFFNYLGAGITFTYDEHGSKISEKTYEKGESIKQYGGFEPRVSANYKFDDLQSIKLSYNRSYQFIHLLSNSTTTSPTDLWVPSTNNVKPQIADQLSAGYFRNFNDNTFEISVEAYYKKLRNQIDYRNGANLVLNKEVEGELVFGKGKTYGAEFLIRKRKGRLTGWMSYTLARSLKKFEAINNGNFFPARQDRIHDFAIVVMYKLSTKLLFSANWVFYTGDAVTFPSGRYQFEGYQVPYYTERNSERMPDYHRLDLGLTWTRKKTSKFESSWNFSLYNAYGRENAYTISFRQNEDVPTRTEAVRIALFKFIPAFSYNFKF